MTREPTDDRKRRSSVAWIAALIALLLSAYFAGYGLIGISKYETPTSVTRHYKSPRTTRIFVPAAWIEAKVKRKTVAIVQRGVGSGREFQTDYQFTAQP